LASARGRRPVGGGVQSGRRIRPVLWVVFGAVALLIGLGMATSAVAAATRAGDVGGAAVCRADFASGCTTERAAVLEYRGYVRGSWFTREQKWLVRVPEGAPRLKDGELLKLEVPRQDGREGLAEGTEVTLIYYSQAPPPIRPDAGMDRALHRLRRHLRDPDGSQVGTSGRRLAAADPGTRLRRACRCAGHRRHVRRCRPDRRRRHHLARGCGRPDRRWARCPVMAPVTPPRSYPPGQALAPGDLRRLAVDPARPVRRCLGLMVRPRDRSPGR
jgi:hypothetical protein